MTSPISGRPLPSSFDDHEEFYNESGLQKILGRMKREPLIPLGCLVTVAAFTNAYRAMRKGDHRKVQRMFRARIAAQGFTVVAMMVGGVYFGAERNREREGWKAREQEKTEEQRLRWIRELETRDEEEKELRALMDKRMERSKAVAAEAARENFRSAEARRRQSESAEDAKNKERPRSSLSEGVGTSQADGQKPVETLEQLKPDEPGSSKN